jgi:hypothetical protein
VADRKIIKTPQAQLTARPEGVQCGVLIGVYRLETFQGMQTYRHVAIEASIHPINGEWSALVALKPGNEPTSAR